MSDVNSAKFMNPNFLSEFIEAFRQYPCLWKIKCDEYRDRNKRDEALNNLLLLTRETIPTADLKFVKDRIESLKQSYRREYRKVKNSMKSGSSADDVYKPKLWYYNTLSFIAEHEAHYPSVSSLSREEEHEEEVIDGEIQEPVSTPPPSQRNLATLPKEDFVVPDKPSFKRKKDFTEERRKKLIEKAMNALDTQEDEFDFTGKTIAAKLRKMDYNQFLRADMLINEVLFKGLQNQLSDNIYIADHRQQYPAQSTLLPVDSPSSTHLSYPESHSPFSSGSTSMDSEVQSNSCYNYGIMLGEAFHQ